MYVCMYVVSYRLESIELRVHSLIYQRLHGLALQVCLTSYIETWKSLFKKAIQSSDFLFLPERKKIFSNKTKIFCISTSVSHFKIIIGSDSKSQLIQLDPNKGDQNSKPLG